MSRMGRVAVVSVIVVLALSGVIVPASTAQSDPANETATNSSVPQHLDVARVDESGRVDVVKNELGDKLAAQLEQSARETERGQLTDASDTIGSEFNRTLSQYEELAASTSDPVDDRTSERFREIQRTQRRYITVVRAFNATRQEYRQAQRSGNTTKARRAARQLEEMSNRVNETGSVLSSSYQRFEETKDTSAGGLIQATTEQVLQSRSEVSQSIFTTTELSVSATSRGSFVDPIRVSGRLQMANGSVIANEEVDIQIRNHTYQAVTDANGNFTISYRPTTLQLGTRSVQVRYVPGNQSEYGGSSDSITVSAEQVSAIINVRSQPSAAAYNDLITVSGEASVSGQSVDALPLVAYIGDVPIGTARTQPNGSYQLQGTVPAGVNAGSQPLRVVFGSQERAIEPTTGSQTIQLRKTDSDIAIVTRRDGSELTVSGQLLTTNDLAVPGQEVEVSVDGAVQSVVTTTQTGQFETVVDISERASRDGSIKIQATYRGAESNINSATAERTISLVSTEPSSRVTLSGLLSAFGIGPQFVENVEAELGRLEAGSQWFWPVVALGLFALMSGAVVRVYERDIGRNKETTDAPDPDQTNVQRMSERLALDFANEQVDNGSLTIAVQTAYAVGRRAIVSSGVSSNPTRTHWEFYIDCKDHDVSESRLSSLATLTELYERASFSREELSRSDAESALETAKSLLND